MWIQNLACEFNLLHAKKESQAVLFYFFYDDLWTCNE